MQLDSVQKEIVESPHSRLLVVAGAGSGKTRVLTERVRNLLISGIEPHNIVCITFTNMAAEEMRERLSDVPGIGDSFIGTIHAFANRLMQNSGEKYEIYTEERETELARVVIRRHCKHLTYDRFLESKDVRKKAEMGIISEEMADEFLLPSERDDFRSMFKQEATDQFESTIPLLCKQMGIITFDELLIKATKYFTTLGARVEHVLVDELQDIGYLEYKFILGLSADNYFFVGDDWQAIYAFKGGDVNIFLGLMKNKDWKVYYLVNNYRSCQDIIKKAEIVINQVDKDKLISKQVNVKNKHKGSVLIDSKFKIKDHLKNISKDKYGDYFLLVRTNKQIYELMQVLDEMSIPYSCFKKGDMSLAELREEISKDTVKLLTVHTSKGLESKNVILYGNFPLRLPSYLVQDDERKVMYVGMTRAIENLVVLN